MRILRSRYTLLLGLIIGCGVLFLALMASVRFGAAQIGMLEVISAFTSYGGPGEDLIIRTLRVPRALIAALVGAALGVAGALMQGLTRNPLADPGILSIETGAALTVVGTVFFLGVSSLSTYALYAFVGAGAMAAVVYGIGSLGRDDMSPMKITIAGAAMAAFLGSMTTAMLILNQRMLDEIRFWLAGSVAGRDLDLLLQVLPYIVVVGLLLALALGRQIHYAHPGGRRGDRPWAADRLGKGRGDGGGDAVSRERGGSDRPDWIRQAHCAASRTLFRRGWTTVGSYPTRSLSARSCSSRRTSRPDWFSVRKNFPWG